VEAGSDSSYSGYWTSEDVTATITADDSQLSGVRYYYEITGSAAASVGE
jgi:hypothetical protein